jgi:hypothetical protein
MQKMNYVVLIKNLRTESVKEGPSFDTHAEAELWIDTQMSIWKEEKAFKIVEN